ncbi:MAG: glycosyltransferase family 9 protein [Deltaproteobacteria bacterium]|nr:glycosyltransferase family 9 protein [Deltaproteobacteria bacterium]
MSRPAVLAFCTTAIGDTLLSTPALAALGRVFDLDVVVHQHRLPLLEAEPYLRDLFPYRNNPFSRLYLITRLRNRSYQELVVMHANHDVIKLFPFLHYERAWNLQGWNLPKRRMTSLDLPAAMHVVDKRLLMASLAGAKQADEPIKIHILPEETVAADQWLTAHGLSPDRPRVALCPGAANLFKRWPAARFGSLVRQLRERGVETWLLGTNSETDLMLEIDRVAGRPVPRLQGVAMRTLAATIHSSDILISNDTGPLHMGQAVGTPILGLFGPTDHLTIGPRDPMHRVLQTPFKCEPCLTKRCQTAGCMTQMQVDMVLQAALEMLHLDQRPRVGEAS